MADKVILVVDDEPSCRAAICEVLTHNKLRTLPAANCAAAEYLWRTEKPDLAILDYDLPDGNALELTQRLRATDPDTPLLILTGHASIELAVNAIKVGAQHLLSKPTPPNELINSVQRWLEMHARSQQYRSLLTHNDPLEPFLGKSDDIQNLAEIAKRILKSNSSVLIEGETGTGKGVLASWLHQNSPRSSRPFINMNCGALSGNLLETELFGHERGSFTGAVQKKLGLLETGHTGTLFLDEIGDMDLRAQTKMLKVLEDKRFRRLGATREQMIDARLIAATHRNLLQLSRDKQFREDLYFRISTITLRVPPLRERRTDIPIIIRVLLDGITRSMGIASIEIDTEALRRLQCYWWPGNVRELRNTLERAVLLRNEDCIRIRDIHFDLSVDVPTACCSSAGTLAEIEGAHIAHVMKAVGGRVAEAAQKLGIPRSSLYQKLKRHRTHDDGSVEIIGAEESTSNLRFSPLKPQPALT